MKRFSCIFFLISILLVSTIPSAFSQTEPLITVDTSENAYDEGDTIVISGKASTVIVGTPVTLQIFFENNLVEIAQIEPAQDGSFTHTIIAKGPLWNNEGEHIVRITYGEGNIAEASFDFFKKKTIPETTDIFEVDAGSSGTFDIEYTIRAGTVDDMIVDSDIFALVVIIESEDDGEITLKLPREDIDAKKSDGTDDTFIILIDGIEVPYDEVSTTSDSRTITIDFEEGDSDIEIIGTFVIPEFGVISIVILAVAIISTIIFSSKKFLLARV